MSRWISITAGLIVATAIVVMLFIGSPADGVEPLREKLLSYGPWAIVVSASLMVGQAIIAPLPANVITITNGLVFGPFWGGLLSWVATLIGASVCWVLARNFGKPFAERIIGPPLESAESFFKRYGLYAVLVARITPLVPFDAVSYGAGIVGVPYSRFLLATAVGCIPSVAIYSYIGAMIAGIYWWVLITLLSLSLLGIIVAARFLRRVPALSKSTA